MLILIAKVIVTPLGVLEVWCRALSALLMWDSKMMHDTPLLDRIWKTKK